MSMTQTQQLNVPALRFPEFSREWLQERLGSYFTFKNGVNAEKSAYGQGHKFINVLDIITDRPIKSENIIGSVSISDKEIEKNRVVYGDILFQRSSETREEVGQSNVYLDREKPATFGGFVIRGHPRKDFSSEFFHSLLKTMKVRKDMTSRSGGSTRYNVGQESLSQTSVSVAPSLHEQQKIASFLSSVDCKIAQLDKKKALLEQYKKGMMQKLFSGELCFKDAQGNDFPDWEEKRLGEIADFTGGGTPETGKPEYWGGEVQWFTPTEIKKKYLLDSKRSITREGLKKSSAKLLPVGTLLLSTRATVGDVAIAQRECSTNQGFQSLQVNPSEYNEFWYYWILRNKKTLLRRSSGSTFLEISKSEIAKIKTTKPCFEEQQKIADFLSSIDRKIELAATEIDYAKSFKKGLLQQMFI